MLSRNFETQPIGEMEPKPTLAHSAMLAFEKPYYQVAGFGLDMVPGLSSADTRKRFADKLDVINSALGDPRIGLGQAGLNVVSDMAGGALPLAPFMALGGAAGAGGAALVGLGAELALPEAALSFLRTPITKLIGTELADYLPALSTAELAKGAAAGYGAYKGMIIPEHVVENYHKETDTLDMRGAIKDWAADNFGFLIPIVPLTGGYLIYKAITVPKIAKESGDYVKKLLAQHEIMKRARQSELKMAESKAMQELAKISEEYERLPKEKAILLKGLFEQRKAEENLKNERLQLSVEKLKKFSKLESLFAEALEDNRISKAEYEWFMQYIKNPDNHENLKSSAIPILKDSQIPIDRATGRVWFQMIDSKQLGNLKNAISDEVSNGFTQSENMALSNYIFHNSMDFIRGILNDNPNLLTAMRGFSTVLEKKLGNKENSLELLDKMLAKYLTKGLKKSEAFSQTRMYKHLKKMGVSDTSRVPYHVPHRVAYKLKLAKKLDNVLRQRTERYKKWFQEGMHNKIKEEMNKVKLLTPEEEIKFLYDKLFQPKKGKKLYRGRSSATFGYKTLEEAGVTEKALQKHDVEFGKGYWFAYDAEHARKYGKIIEEIRGNFKILNVNNIKDKELFDLYKEIHDRFLTGEMLKHPKPKNYISTSALIHQFRERVKAKGYEAIERTELPYDNYQRPEIMFFEKPKINEAKEMFFEKPKFSEQKALIKNFKKSPHYYRLRDVADVWANGKHLLDRVHLENEYDRQIAFNKILQQFIAIVDSNATKLANPERVTEYLKSKIERTLPELKKIPPERPLLPSPKQRAEPQVAEKAKEEIAPQKGKENEKKPAPKEEKENPILKQNQDIVKKSKSKVAKAEYQIEESRYKQFSEKEAELERLVQCVIGEGNG